jgi:UDP-N-acetylmuramoyl-tripeptide--D-alanyl-D-alanine ligase
MAPEKTIIGKDHVDVAAQLRAFVKRGDWLLFKGSRGMRMERVLEALKRGKGIGD